MATIKEQTERTEQLASDLKNKFENIKIELKRDDYVTVNKLSDITSAVKRIKDNRYKVGDKVSKENIEIEYYIPPNALFSVILRGEKSEYTVSADDNYIYTEANNTVYKYDRYFNLLWEIKAKNTVRAIKAYKGNLYYSEDNVLVKLGADGERLKELEVPQGGDIDNIEIYNNEIYCSSSDNLYILSLDLIIQKAFKMKQIGGNNALISDLKVDNNGIFVTLFAYQTYALRKLSFDGDEQFYFRLRDSERVALYKDLIYVTDRYSVKELSQSGSEQKEISGSDSASDIAINNGLCFITYHKYAPRYFDLNDYKIKRLAVYSSDKKYKRSIDFIDDKVLIGNDMLELYKEPTGIKILRK